MGTGQSKTDFTQFRTNLKEARGKAKLTQSALGEMTGIDKNTIGNYERNAGEKGTVPNLENICAIADALNVSIDWLVGREKAKPKEANVSEMNERIALDALIWLIKNNRGFMLDSLPASVISSASPFCESGDLPGFGFWISGGKANKLSEEIDGFLKACDGLEKSETKIPQDTIIAAKDGMKSRLLDDYSSVFEPYDDELPF